MEGSPIALCQLPGATTARLAATAQTLSEEKRTHDWENLALGDTSTEMTGIETRTEKERESA